MKLNVIDLFSGVGGLSYGFSHDPDNIFNIVLANEVNPVIAKAYTLNNPTVDMLTGDIAKLDSKILNDHLKGIHIHLIVGGPPCQSYSTLGKRQMDKRANLFLEYCRVLTLIKPEMFLFENVPGILSMDNGKLFPLIQKKFLNCGYFLKFKLLNAVDYGVPQYRLRVILVGTLGPNNFEFPSPDHFDGPLFGKPYVTVSDALSDLPILKSGEELNNYLSDPKNDFQHFVHDGKKLTENSSPKNGKHLLEIMRALPDGGSKKDLPENLRPKSGYGNTYAKMWWNKPAPTITRNFATPSSSRCIHPRDSRALTTREGARLQSFPDSYIFYGSRSDKNLEIGNAVPPLLSIRIAQQTKIYFLNKLMKKEDKTEKAKAAIRY